MLISEGRRKSVGYLSHYQYDEHNKQFLEPHGTVFFVGIDDGKGAFFIYAVTACHCVKSYASDEELYLEISGHPPIKTLRKHWVMSKTSDVACLHLKDPLPVKFVPLNEFVESADVSTLRAGHNVFIVGLFTEFPHRLDNLEVDPVVRFGRVANPFVETHVFLDSTKLDPDKDSTLIKALTCPR